MSGPAKMPPAPALRRMYLEDNLSLDQLAARFGANRYSVYKKLRRHAAREGLSWPLKSNRPDWRRIACAKRWDSVRVDLLRVALADCKHEHGLTFGQIADLAGIPAHFVHHLPPDGHRVNRAYADRLVRALDRIDGAAPERRPKTRALAERRAVVAELTRHGHAAAAIAERLGVSDKTVVRDRAILRKQAA